MNSTNIGWNKLIKILTKNFNKSPDLNAVLFLIGIQELGQGFSEFTKEQKQDLIHVATCKILSFSGYYSLLGQDNEGWPIWKNERISAFIVNGKPRRFY